jgi:hypothetical protein
MKKARACHQTTLFICAYDPPSKLRPTASQALALLSSRLCLSISPESSFAPSLVADHMATALAVSLDRFALVSTYPSEPVLAVAARAFMAEKTCIQALLAWARQFFTHGVVHKGEVMVRLLSLLAIDKAMRDKALDSYDVIQVSLRDFLKSFNREDAWIDDDFSQLSAECRHCQ